MIISEYWLIPDMFYARFQEYYFQSHMVIVTKAWDSLTSVFKHKLFSG